MHNRRWLTGTIIALAAMAALASPASAQVKAIISGGFSAAYRDLLPRFETASGIAVTTTTGGSVGSGPNTIPSQIRRGVPTDIVILAREGLGELIADDRIVGGSDRDLARSIIGVVVRAGAPRPDISTVDGLRQTLLRVSSIAVSSSTSGVYLTKTLFPKLGIAAQVAGKTSMNGAAAVGRGEAELGLQQVSELLPLSGVDFVGTIPGEVQYVTTYAAAVVQGSAQIDAAKQLIAFLASPAAFAAIRASGMEPASGAVAPPDPAPRRP
jgi:molybdate transport system substrate-binding protein